MLDQILAALASKKLIIGKEKTLKLLRKNNIEKIFLASNAPELWKKLFKHYCELVGCELFILEKDSSELGELCKKPFNITVLAIAR